ncbi:MAG: DUF4173 domain-containing protein [Verrucomicrobiia bacterium]|jgi:hypothetical protein
MCLNHDDIKYQQALVVLMAAVAFGVLGDALLRATPWGLNAALCVTAVVVAAAALRWRFEPARNDLALLAVATLFAWGCAWRDSGTLKMLDAAAVLLALALAVWRAQGGSLAMASLTAYIGGIGDAVFGTLGGAGRLAWRDVAWTKLPGQHWRQAASVAVGLLIALPLLTGFGALLSSADAVFERLLLVILDINFVLILKHLFLAALLAWLAGGYLRALLLKTRPETPPQTADSTLALGYVETCTVLACLNLLFLAFIAVQFRHLFGGAEHVQVMPGLSYAVYARRGFFELVWVAALVLPLLLGVDWLLRRQARKVVFRALAGALVAMLFVVMASALERMRLYQQEYGLTELRLYTTAFMAWLAMVFVWFAATVLRGRRERFICGALAAGAVAVVALHVVNPDAFIVRVNAARAQAGRPFDAVYAASLSADAVPELLAALPDLKIAGRQAVVAVLRRKWFHAADDWRNWNWSRAEAQRLVREWGK